MKDDNFFNLPLEILNAGLFKQFEVKHMISVVQPNYLNEMDTCPARPVDRT